MHEPHPGPVLKETWLHLIVDSSISLIAHQHPHNEPSRGHLGPFLHNAPCVVGTSANFCRLKAPHFLGGPIPLSQALDPSCSSKSSAPVHGKPSLMCSFLAALSGTPKLSARHPTIGVCRPLSGKGSTSCSPALCLHHHNRDRTDSTTDLAYLSSSCSDFAFLTSSERPLRLLTHFSDPRRYDLLPGADGLEGNPTHLSWAH